MQNQTQQHMQTQQTDLALSLNWEENKLTGAKQKLADFISTIQQNADVNSNNMPLTYVDPTVIAECTHWCESVDDIPNDKFKAAIVPIQFEDGLPTVNGLPFWERLEGETTQYYQLFKLYRDMKYYANSHLNSRSIARLAEEIGVPGRLLGILSRIYHWLARCKAFDMYKGRELELRKQRDVEALESKHSAYALELLENAMTFLKKNPKQLTPKVALDMVELGMKYSRISAGLLGDKPGQQASSVHQTNIAIQSNSSTQVDQSQNGVVVNAGTGPQSATERKLSDSLKDSSNLAAVLHVLNRSGALNAAAAIHQKQIDDASSTEDEIIDVTPTEEGADE